MTDEFIKTLRIIEFLGDIVKNYSSSIKRTPRMDIINLMNESCLKAMGALCHSLGYMVDTVIEIINEKSEKDRAAICARSEIESEIKEFFSQLWMRFVEVNVTNLSYSLQCDRIIEDVRDFQNLNNSSFFSMVQVEFLIRVSNGKLPVKEIESCFKGKNKLDLFSQNVLKNNIAMYLQNNQYNTNDKQSVCSMLGFSIKDMFIETEKNKQLMKF